ncbi:PREDICTED: uncharacterized protein LOC108549420 [Eufriesea mexicana]|uniref:uncharacterized protein LOC108549420 n=1 Tax=Eufriesea mexicana TaxID=516756 RepID=UPI00083C7891|nr:PREDICTED: uncharacterized protein LOC108549420 [Eufriesea mexicana]
MSPTKWNLVSMVMLSLMSVGIQTLPKETSRQPKQQPQKREAASPSHSTSIPPFWEHILRESVFRTISLAAPGNYQLYRRLLEAPFHGGPVPSISSDASSVILSRGDVHQLPNGRWLFCQQGCIDCGLCIDHTHPTVKWVLRGIKRVSSHGATRQDLQLTIVPQLDGSYHMRSLWPQSYVYVTSQGEQDLYLSDHHSYRNDGSAYVEDNFSGQQRRFGSFWTYADRNSQPEISVDEKPGNDTDVRKNLDDNGRENLENTRVTPKKSADEERDDSRNVKRQRPEVKFEERQSLNGSSLDDRLTASSRAKLVPKLILGTDQLGQKHLVHVVPADMSGNTSFMNSVVSNILSTAGQNRTAYQRILRRIYDSLSSNKRSIESFLEPARSTETPSLGKNEEQQQQETRSGLAGLGQIGRTYSNCSRQIQSESALQKRWPYIVNWSKSRRMNNDTSYFLYQHPKVLNSIREFKNVSDRMYPKLSVDVHNSTFRNSFETKNVTRTNRKYSDRSTNRTKS